MQTKTRCAYTFQYCSLQHDFILLYHGIMSNPELLKGDFKFKEASLTKKQIIADLHVGGSTETTKLFYLMLPLDPLNVL